MEGIQRIYDRTERANLQFPKQILQEAYAAGLIDD